MTAADDHAADYENASHGIPLSQSVPIAMCESEVENNKDTSHGPSDPITEQAAVPAYINASNSTTESSALENTPATGENQYENLGHRPGVGPSEYDRIQKLGWGRGYNKNVKM